MKQRISNLLEKVRRARESNQLAVGFLPTTDSAVLVVAAERGFFKEQGLEVRLARDTSWHRLRDGVADGRLQGAHLPGTVPLTTTLGIDCDARPMRTACVLSLNGSSLLVSHELAESLAVGRADPLEQARLLRDVVRARQLAGEGILRFAVSSRHSNGSYDLRYWLAAGGIDPAHDVELVAITPARVLASLRAGRYAGAWLDEPYGTIAHAEGLGHRLLLKHAFWNNSLGKVLAVDSIWSERNPRTHRRMLRALLLAAQWLDSNREQAVEILARREYLNLDADLVAASLGTEAKGGAEVQKVGFWRHAASFPWYSQAVWYLGQMIRWGDYADVLDFKKTAQSVYSPRLYREAARDLSLPYPTIGYKDEGRHDKAWDLGEASGEIQLGPDLYFDRRVYQPRQTMTYLSDLEISHIKAPLEAMWAIR